MHQPTTDLAKSTLQHAKSLIKEMDAVGFAYDRPVLVKLLFDLQQQHKNAHEDHVVTHLEDIIDQLEQVEIAFHDWQYENEHKSTADDMKSLLQGIRNNAMDKEDDKIHKTPWYLRSYRFFSYVEVMWLSVLLLLGSRVIVGEKTYHFLGYILFCCAGLGVLLLLVRRMHSWTGVVATLCLVCGAVWTWATMM